MPRTRLHRIAAALVWTCVLAGAAAVPANAQFDTPNRQFHNATAFPLDGKHRTLACESCHLSGAYKGTPTRCFDCHWVRRQDDRYRLQLGSQCEQCHRPTTWAAAQWDHNAMTAMPLGAAHRQLSCVTCHKNNSFRGAQVACVSCHQQDFQATRTPNHVAAGFPTTCEACHRVNDTAFTQARFDHQASFPLVGVHAQATCASCHRNNVFKGTARDCLGCHRAQYDRTTTPNHAAAGFPTTCENCHRPSDPSFSGATFNHNQVFNLVGRHAQTACATCHVNNVFKGTARDCIGCHRPQYDRTTTPNHVAAGFPTTCENCHRPSDPSFSGATFNHNQVFSLVGRHAQTACATCHVNNVFKGTARDCIGCHRPQYDRTTTPNHRTAGFSTSCESCHSPSAASFSGASFNHSSFFQLVGRHAGTSCTSCHGSGIYKGTPTTCVGCHQASYDRTTTPNHRAAGFSTSCESCHSPSASSFSGASFSHSSYFQLVGRHASTACTSCHGSGVYKGTARDCIGCHRAQYDRTTTPNHRTAGFSTSCESCHSASASSFTGASFNHSSYFQLAGRHASTSCTSCHGSGVYKGTPTTCVGCHQASYDRTTNPNHRAAGFPTSCESCHRNSDSSWSQGTFSHRFGITSGPHRVSCTSCHTTSGTFKVFNCLTCHDKWKMDDKHKSRAGYRYDSPTCYGCHPSGRGD